MNWEERLSELKKTREENGPVRHDYECDICRDALFTFLEDGTAVRCICLVKKINRQHLKNMGLNTDLMSLDKFREDTPTARFLKNKAVKYLRLSCEYAFSRTAGERKDTHHNSGSKRTHRKTWN